MILKLQFNLISEWILKLVLKKKNQVAEIYWYDQNEAIKIFVYY